MKNVLEIIAANFPKIVTEFKVTEAFIFNGELHMTSEWEIDNSLFNSIENLVLSA